MNPNTQMLNILKGCHVFILEDNLENRVVFQMIFIKYGATVDFDRWGRDTLSRLNMVNRVDLIILDLMLPHGASGFDIYDEIQALQKYNHVPIVAVSAMDPSVAIPKAQEKGFSGFIAKPIDNYVFPKQIATILSGEKLWDAGGRQ